MRIQETPRTLDVKWQALEIEECEGWGMSEPAVERGNRLLMDSSLCHSIKAQIVSDWIQRKTGQRLVLH